VSTNNHIKATVSGLTILDNLSRVDDGKFALKQNNCVMEVSKVLENCDHDEDVSNIAAKIFSKITSLEDMLKELKTIEKFNIKKDYNDSK
jgi:hypothetical protein